MRTRLRTEAVEVRYQINGNAGVCGGLVVFRNAIAVKVDCGAISFLVTPSRIVYDELGLGTLVLNRWESKRIRPYVDHYATIDECRDYIGCELTVTSPESRQNFMRTGIVIDVISAYALVEFSFGKALVACDTIRVGWDEDKEEIGLTAVSDDDRKFQLGKFYA